MCSLRSSGEFCWATSRLWHAFVLGGRLRMRALPLALNQGWDFWNDSILILLYSFPGRSFVMICRSSSREGGFFSSFALQTKCFGQMSQIQFRPGHGSWTELKEISILPQFVPGWDSVVADALSRLSQVIGAEWNLHQEVFCLRKRWPVTIDLCTSSLNHLCGVYFVPVLDSMAAGTDAMLQSWDFLLVYAFPPFALIPQLLVKLWSSPGTVITLIAHFLAAEEVVSRFSRSPEAPFASSGQVGSSVSAAPSEVPPKPPCALVSCLATIQRFAKSAGFSAKVAGSLGCSCRPSSVANYQSKWSVYRCWCVDTGHSVSNPTGF